MHQSYVPFSKLAVDAVFKILAKEKSETKYGEKLALYLEQNSADQNYPSDVIIKTYAPKCLKEKIPEDSEIDEYILSKGKVDEKKTIKYHISNQIAKVSILVFLMKQISKLWKTI